MSPRIMNADVRGWGQVVFYGFALSVTGGMTYWGQVNLEAATGVKCYGGHTALSIFHSWHTA